MWIMTANGFFSAVSFRGDASYLLVRSRTDEALVYLCEQMKLDKEEIAYTEDADYLWRLKVSKETFAEFLAVEVLNNLEYANFKSYCKAYGAPTKYLTFLNDVWTSGLDNLQETGFYKTLFPAKTKYHSFAHYDEDAEIEEFEQEIKWWEDQAS